MQASDFQEMVNRDRKNDKIVVHPWMIEWEWAESYHKYNGPEDLLRWMKWTNQNPVNQIIPSHLLEDGIRLVESRNRSIIETLLPGTEYDFRNLDETTALDYFFLNLIPRPKHRQVRTVLDFGAGFGRQVNLWWQKNPGLSFTAMDGIETAYCLQNLYYQFFTPSLNEYADQPDTFQISEKPGIYHLPTWRTDLLPTDFFDVIINVQVLQEINENLVLHMLNEFKRCLKPGGALYVRDHESRWQPAHHIDIASWLRKEGFHLEFFPYWVDDAHHDRAVPNQPVQPDIHGIPRIWRKQDPERPHS